ncbi:tripartite tricarboxylate transporter substrate binding protein [Ramlibacter ginsenosidimutans]|uniref:Tripartite tricarboxylate transporter substrate binding protein n=1 Tax=Ramlibacter ginsenosidimutans TaxID=502333 RepID=A0A934TNV5_9BURK|nr:tripartite tricarboxylate transporter substrate binding protein [Ramlibacter ginsenosidimutans]MBK6004722.1 tripartite tricarboxylate transporter substrate binding protein [Ramlibacter ginsenosidimutans]
MQRRLAIATLLLAAVAAQAQDKWPSKPITYVVPFGAGGTTDVLARLVTPKAGAALGTTFVIENKPGAGGGMGSDFTAKAPPDGYTIQGGTISSHAINVSLYSRLPYDPVRNFTPITMIGSMPNVLVVRADSPYKTVQDVIAAAKNKPGSINYASSGSGTSQHLSGVFFEQMTGGKMVHVPYKSSAESLNALLSGQGADIIFENLAPALPQIQGGKIRALGVTSARRSSILPDVPAISEVLPGFDISSWQAVFAPAGVPKPIVDRLAAEMIKAINDPEVKSKLVAQGIEPGGMTPAELAAFQKSEVAKWAKVIKAGNIKLD